MFSTPFNHDLIRKAVVLFGTTFNEVILNRNGLSIKVPISYGPREKIVARVTQDPNLDRNVAIQLPRMSFEMIGGPRYDNARKMNTMKRYVKKNTDTGIMSSQYVPVPYDINFRLYVFAKTSGDAHAIAEMIFPYFTPDFTIHARLIPEIGLEHVDIPLILNSAELLDEYDGDFNKRQLITWTFDFTMKYTFYGPIKTSKIIKFSNTQMYVASTEDIEDSVGITDPAVRIHIRPGLTAGGEPTSVLAESVPLNEIDADDDFGFITTVTELDDIT